MEHPSGDSLTSRPELLLQWWYSEFFPVSRRPVGLLTSGFAVSWTLVPGWFLLIRADASAVRRLVSGPLSSESSKSNCSPSSSSSSTSEAPSGAAEEGQSGCAEVILGSSKFSYQLLSVPDVSTLQQLQNPHAESSTAPLSSQGPPAAVWRTWQPDI